VCAYGNAQPGVLGRVWEGAPRCVSDLGHAPLTTHKAAVCARRIRAVSGSGQGSTWRSSDETCGDHPASRRSCGCAAAPAKRLHVRFPRRDGPSLRVACSAGTGFRAVRGTTVREPGRNARLSVTAPWGRRQATTGAQLVNGVHTLSTDRSPLRDLCIRIAPKGVQPTTESGIRHSWRREHDGSQRTLVDVAIRGVA